MHSKIKKTLAALAVTVAASVPLIAQAPAAEAVVIGRSCTIQSDRWGLWHGVGTYRGFREYYGPSRFFRSDAWHDCANYLG